MGFHKNAERGSASVTGMVALVALALSSFYVMQNQQKVNDTVVHARVKSTSDSAALSNMNAVAQFKALLNNGKVGGEYLPALFPQNYWLADWRQITKNPQIPTDDVQPLNGSDWFKLSLVDTGDMSSQQLTQVLNGTKSQTMLKPQDGFIRILKANFNKAIDHDYVETVDVEVKTTKIEKGQTSTIISQARIPVPVPQPSNPILEISPVGTNVWTSNFTGINPGEYDLRVTASGVVYKAMIFVNDENPIELSVFNKDTGEPTNHAATNVLAKNVVIGTTSYQFQGFVADPKNCTMAPVDGQYTIRAVLYNAKGEISESPEHEVAKTFTVATSWGLGKDLTDDEFKNACKDECPYYDGTTYETEVPLDAQDRKYGDYSRDHEMFMRNEQIKVKSVKFCENLHAPAEMFYANNSRPPANWGEISAQGWELIDYVYYTVPQCKRKFLFVRGACGCFADETMITMGDGVSLKKITELTAHDQVWNPITHRAQSIVRMTSGPEKIPMFDVQIEGKTVRVTGHHPFPTSLGLKQAFELQEGDRVRTEAGSLGVIQKITTVTSADKAPIVWNLQLAGSEDLRDHYVLANGVVTGDLYIQTRLQKNIETTDRWVFEK